MSAVTSQTCTCANTHTFLTHKETQQGIYFSVLSLFALLDRERKCRPHLSINDTNYGPLQTHNLRLRQPQQQRRRDADPQLTSVVYDDAKVRVGSFFFRSFGWR